MFGGKRRSKEEEPEQKVKKELKAFSSYLLRNDISLSSPSLPLLFPNIDRRRQRRKLSQSRGFRKRKAPLQVSLSLSFENT